MNHEKVLKRALERAIDLAGNMRRLSERTGVNYATINKFYNGQQDIANIPLATMEKLFPAMRIYCFPDEAPEKTHINLGANAGSGGGQFINGDVHGGEFQLGGGAASVRTADQLRDLVMDVEISDSAKVRILKILREESRNT